MPPKTAPIPLPYTVFFLWVEPLATLLGALCAFFWPQSYLNLTHPATALAKHLPMPTATWVALRQLGNLYLAFAMTEAAVLRATNDLRVWRALLVILLIADFGHLFSCLPLGLKVYYEVNKWSAIDWGNIAFVYCGATMRICFLTAVGMGGPRKAKAKARKSITATASAIEDTTKSLVATPKAEPAPAKTPAKSTRRRKTKSGE